MSVFPLVILTSTTSLSSIYAILRFPRITGGVRTPRGGWHLDSRSVVLFPYELLVDRYYTHPSPLLPLVHNWFILSMVGQLVLLVSCNYRCSTRAEFPLRQTHFFTRTWAIASLKLHYGVTGTSFIMASIRGTSVGFEGFMVPSKGNQPTICYYSTR